MLSSPAPRGSLEPEIPFDQSSSRGSSWSNKPAAAGRLRVGMEEQPRGKHDPGKSCWMGLSPGLRVPPVPSQSTGTPEQRVCTPQTSPTPHQPRGLFFQQAEMLSHFKQLHQHKKKCSQAAEKAQEFKPAAPKKKKKKAVSNENFFCRQNAISDTAGTKPAAINALKDAPSVVIAINFKFKLGD